MKIAAINGKSIMQPKEEGEVDIEGIFNGLAGDDRLRITVDATPSNVTKLTATFPSTFRGIVGKTKAQVGVNAEFDDDTIINGLFSSSGNPNYPGLVEFVSTNEDAAAVSQKRGTATLLGNDHQKVKVTAYVPGTTVTVAVEFACNLDPAVTDIDLGSSSNLPLAIQSPGDEFDVELRVNSGSQNIGPFAFSIIFDADQIAFVKDGYKEGTDLKNGGQSKSLIAESTSAGVLKVVGVPNKKNQKGAKYHLCTVTFRVKDGVAGLIRIEGKVDKLVEPDVVGGTTDIGVEGRVFVAGNIVFVAAESRRNARSMYTDFMYTDDDGDNSLQYGNLPIPKIRAFPTPTSEGKHNRKRRGECDTREFGDADGDCVFTIVDSAYTTEYVVEALVDFTGTYGDAFEANMPDNTSLANMDADRNGIIDSYDAFYLARAIVDMARFVDVETLKFEPTTENTDENDNGCVAALEVQVLMSGDKVDDADVDEQQTAVFFDIATEKEAVVGLFAESVDDCDACSGSLLVNVDHTSNKKTFYGGLIRAERVDEGTRAGKGFYRASFQTNMVTSKVGKLGLSVIVVTLDSDLEGHSMRNDFLVGLPRSEKDLVYNDNWDFTVPVTDSVNTSFSSKGYTPLMYIEENEVTGDLCRNDFVPSFNESLYEKELPEYTANGTAVVQVAASDEDEGESGEITLSVLSTTKEGAFKFNTTSGQLTTNTLFDAEKADSYTVEIQVKDKAFPFRTNKTKIVVTIAPEAAPEFETNGKDQYEATIPEWIDVNSTVVQVNASDADGGQDDILTYAIVGRDDNPDSFVINETSGRITTTRTLNTTNEQDSYTLTIQATDGALPYRQATVDVIIAVTDHTPSFNQTEYTAELVENTADGVLVMQVFAGTEDADRNVKFSIENRDDDPIQFSLDETTGEITTNISAAGFDFETRTAFSMTIRITDGFAEHRYNTTSVVINVTAENDNAPVFVEGDGGEFTAASENGTSFYNVSVSAGIKPGAAFLQLKATDGDLPKDQNEVRFQWNNGTSQADQKRFKLNETNGEISLDFVNIKDTGQRNFTLFVDAIDGGNLNTTSEIYVSQLMRHFEYFLFRNGYEGLGGHVEVHGYGPPVLDRKFEYKAAKAPSVNILRAHLAVNADGIWHDTPGRLVKVVLQVLDSTSSLSAASQAVKIKVTPSDKLKGALAEVGIDATDQTGTCNTAISTGMCTASVNLPQGWFTSGVDSAPATVSYMFADSRTDAVTLASVVTIHNRLEFSGKRVVMLDVPFRGFKAGTTLKVPILANSEYATASWELLIETDSELEILGLDVDKATWTSKFAPSSKQKATVNAILAKENTGTAKKKAGLEKLADLRLKVKSGTSAGTKSNITCSVLFLESVKEKGVVESGTAALFVDRTTKEEPFAETGAIHVIKEADVGALAWFEAGSTSTSFVNTARLNGKEISIGLISQIVRSDASMRAVAASELSCSTSDQAALQISSDCDSVFLNGSETQGSESVTIIVGAQINKDVLFQSSMDVSVWWPQLPVQFTVSDQVLSPIQQWLRNDSITHECRQAYQRTRFDALADFTQDGSKTVSVRVTSLLKDVLKSDNDDVAMVGEGVIIGRSPGTANIRIENSVAGVPGDQDGGDFSITVAPDGGAELKIVGMHVFVVTRLGVASTFHSPFAGGTDPAEITVANKLEREDEAAGIAAVISFDDGALMMATFDDGLVLSVAKEHRKIIRVPEPDDKYFEQDSILAVGSGKGKFVKASLRVGDVCGDQATLAFGYGDVVANVKPPEGLRVILAINGVCTLTMSCDVDECTSAFSPGGCKMDLTVAGDPLETLTPTLTTTMSAKVYAIFPDKDAGTVLKDMTLDPRVTYDTNSSSGRLQLCSNSLTTCNGDDFEGVISINTTDESKGGDSLLSIYFSHADLRANITIPVITTTSISTALRPFPTYAGSGNFPMQRLHRYRNDQSNETTWQHAVVKVSALLSDGSSRDVSTASGVSYVTREVGAETEDNSVVDISSKRIVSVAVSADDLQSQNYSVDVVGTYKDYEIEAATLTVTYNTTEVTELNGIRLSGNLQRGLMGIANETDEQIMVQATFSDGTKHPQVISASGVHLLPNAILFKSLNTDVLVVDNDGVALLVSNGDAPTTVVVTYADETSVEDRSLAVSCDLLPDVGDVDLGEMRKSAPISPKAKNKPFTVDVRINTGGITLGSFEFEIKYNPNQLQAAETIGTGSDWPGGTFVAVVDPPGVIKLGGAPDTEDGSVKGSNQHIATITFTGLVDALVEIEGKVTTFAKNDLKGSAIGGATPRAFISGAVTVAIGDVDRRQRRSSRSQNGYRNYSSQGLYYRPTDISLAAPSSQPAMAASRSRREAEVCDDPPCKDSECAAPRHTGDANGDCVFDIRDVGFLQIYKVEATYNFQRDVGIVLKAGLLDAQVKMMDADLDGEITIADARYLARVNFNLLRFISEIVVRPVQDEASYGLVSINVSTYSKGNTAEPGDSTVMYIDLSHADKDQQPLFDKSNFTIGGEHRVGKGNSLYGMMAKMKRRGPLYKEGAVEGLPRRCFLSPRDDDLCDDDDGEADETRFYYDSETITCKEVKSRGCGPNEYTTLEKCLFECMPSWTHSVSISTPLVADDVGIALVMITFNSEGVTSSGRDVFLSRIGNTYKTKLSVTLDVPLPGSDDDKTTEVPVLATRGYSPLVYFNNTVSSDEARNDYAPDFKGDMHINVTENTAVPAVISHLNAVDPDSNGTVTYTIDHENATEKDNGDWVLLPFTLNKTGHLILTEKQDYENASHVHRRSFKVTATDEGPPFSLTSTEVVIVDLIDKNDNTPEFDSAAYAANLNFDVSEGTPLLRVIASDKDSNTELGGTTQKFVFY